MSTTQQIRELLTERPRSAREVAAELDMPVMKVRGLIRGLRFQDEVMVAGKRREHGWKGREAPIWELIDRARGPVVVEALRTRTELERAWS